MVPPPRQPRTRPSVPTTSGPTRGGAPSAGPRPVRTGVLAAVALLGGPAAALPSTASAAGCVGAHRSVASQGTASAEKAVRCLVNRRRAAHGLRALRFESHAARAAQRHTDDMVQRHYFSHVSPGGSDIADRVNATGLRWRTVGENIAVGQRTPARVVSDWMRSPGHRANILDGEFTMLGVGTARRGTTGCSGPTWTQVFARPRG